MAESGTGLSRPEQKGAYLALILLSFVNFLNQVDRRTLVTLFPLIGVHWSLSDTQLGLAVSLFTLGRTLISLPAAWLADKKGILRILRPSVFTWSMLGALSGWAGSLGAFLGLRFGVGLMDGVNGPLDLAYLGKSSPKAKRGLHLSFYSIALYLGSGLGVIYAGAAGERLGWRWALSIPGLLGLLVVLGLLWLPRQDKLEENSSDALKTKNLSWLLVKPLPGIFLGGALGVFASTAIISWLPTYLVRTYQMPLSRAGLLTGGVIIPASVLGGLLGGWLSDRLGKKDSRIYYWISSVSLMLAGVFGLAGLFNNRLFGLVLLFFLSSFCFTIPVSPLLVLVQEAVPVNRLARTQAAFGLTTQIIGAAPATGLVGLLSDQVGLGPALALPFLAAGLGGGIILTTGR